MKTINVRYVPQEISRNYARMGDFLTGVALGSEKGSAVLIEPELDSGEWMRITGKFEDLLLIQKKAQGLHLRSVSFQDNGMNNPGEITYVIARGSRDQLASLVELIEK